MSAVAIVSAMSVMAIMSAVAIPVIMAAPMRIMLFMVVPVAVVAVMRRMPVGPPVRLRFDPAVNGAMAVPVAVAVMRPVVTMVLPVPGGHVMAEIEAVTCVNSAAVDDDRTDGLRLEEVIVVVQRIEVSRARGVFYQLAYARFLLQFRNAIAFLYAFPCNRHIRASESSSE